ncbi:hypothetical protein Y032_0005g2482 [Ancylostoma ceylanicum]|nr:hypothetical protein Y032_0005g2482 [Ancylostoma ceylanicum]
MKAESCNKELEDSTEVADAPKPACGENRFSKEKSTWKRDAKTWPAPGIDPGSVSSKSETTTIKPQPI